ncbi:hypothetical protein BSKO_04559 [Bryopsis sp. KO-2023]|nr:hypothetical protein BSKO_04559 [Bryopsis sp. KO-2023]
MYTKRAQVMWKRRWFYLVDDRLCYTVVRDDESVPQNIKYISMDRVPVRPRPQKYTPNLGVCFVESRQVKNAENVFSIVTGAHTYFLSAETHEEVRCQTLEAENLRLSMQADNLRKKLAENDHEYYGKYLDGIQQTEKLERLLRDNRTYEIVVTTGQMKGAGTEARAYIELLGMDEDQSSGVHQLRNIDSSSKPFQRGQTDKFVVRCENLGMLAAVKMWHDNSGRSPEWFLEEVAVSRKGIQDIAHFPCNRWLATDLDDGRICRLLMAGDHVQTIQYKVDILTSDLLGAGTDATVYILLHGSRRDGRRLVLTSGHDDFERGQVSSFTVDDVDVGSVEEVTIGHDGTGSGPSWHVEHLVVTKIDDCEDYLFPCRQWFDEKHGDGRIERRVPVRSDLGQLVQYHIVLYTSDLRGAGTDSEIFIVIHGEDGDTGKIAIPSSPGSFQRGRNDDFRFEAEDVGFMSRITVAVSTAGTNNDWHCHFIKAKNEETQEIVFFCCNDWIGGERGGGISTRTLCATKQDPRDKIATYEIVVATSDIRGAGTDANVFVHFLGELGESGEMKLPAHPESFERGSIDKFLFKLPYIGPLKKLRIWHDNTGQGPSWHLSRIQVACHKHKQVPMLEFRSTYVETWEAEVPFFLTAHQRISNVEGEIVGKKSAYMVEHVWRADEPVWGAEEGILTEQDLFTRKKKFSRAWVEKYSPRFSDLIVAPDLEIGCMQLEWAGSKAGLKKRLLAQDKVTDDRIDCNITVVTSDLKGAGTDANIALNLIGTLGETGYQKLSSAKEAFERGKVDKFRLRKLTAVGDLVALAIASDGAGELPEWHVAEIIVTLKDKEPYHFPVHKWLDKSHGLKTTVKVRSEAEVNQYDVTVITSNIKRSGTDANVFLQLIGSDRQSQETKLSAGKEAFERGTKDKFQMKLPNVGEIKELKLRHDGKTANDAWRPEMVVIKDAKTGMEYFFQCDEWLDSDRGLSRTLAVSTSPPQKREYKIVTITSNMRGAGTDANVFMNMKGDLGSTGQINLDSSRNDFEKGQTDEFTVSTRYVGEPKSLDIWHDGKGLCSGWHLSIVHVTDTISGKVYYFECDQWLDKSEGDGSTSRTLEASTEDPRSLITKYKLVVYTGKMKGAGTDANVFVQLFGDQRQSAKILLKARGKSDFERGQRDEFEIECKDLRELTKLRIGHDNKGLASSWNLSHVDVICGNTAQQVIFPAGCWLSKEKGLEVDLYPVGAPGARSANRYRICIITSDVRGAGTDASVFLKLLGQSGESEDLRMDDSSGNPFERGQTDSFDVDSNNLGDLKSLQIWQDGGGLGSDWKLSMVSVTDLGANRTWYFWCDDWIKGKGKERALQAMETDPRDNMIQYKVITHTSNIKGAATDSNVFVDLIGKSRSSGPIPLKSKKKDTFERGEVDEFVLEFPFTMGPLTELRIWHDDRGLGSGWHLDHVVVKEMKAKEVYYFFCQQWLDSSKDDQKIERILKASRHLPVADYSVTVLTSNVRGAGTDSNVFMEIFGNEGKTKRFVLDRPGANDFERGSVDTFTLHGRNVGIMSGVLVGHDNRGLGAAWHLDKIEVLNMSTSERAVFLCGKWFSTTKDDKKIERELLPSASTGAQDSSGNVPWHLVVFTGDIRGAGTDADVSVELIGQNGKIGPTMLEAKDEAFERASRDSFRIFGPAIGPLTELVIGHNGKGRGPAWNLDSVEITDESCGKVYVFQCQRWLDKAHGMGVTLSPTERASGNCTYEVQVTTGRTIQKGLEGRMNVKVIGDRADSGEHTLNAGESLSLEPGVPEVYQLHGLAEVGKMTTLTVSHTFKRPWRGMIKVTSKKSGKEAYFVQDSPLDRDSGVSRLPAHEGPGCDYIVEVKTSDIRNAGTDATISLAIAGSMCRTGPHELQRQSTKNFERNQEDQFCLDLLPDVGQFSHIEIGHDGKGLGAGWHLAWVKITNTATGASATFTANRWLDKSEGDGATTQILRAEAAPDGQHTFSMSTLKSQTAPPRVFGMDYGYKITFWTSNVWLGGTAGQVCFEMVGDAGSSGVLIPTQEDGNSKTGFDRGMAVVFMYPHLPYLGQLKEMRVGVDSKGIFSGWHLRIVEVEHVSSGARWRFQCHSWIDKRCGWQRVLYADNAVTIPPGTV